MHRYIKGWRLWVIGSSVVVFLAMAASEYFDLPHILLNGPTTPRNYAELVLEAILITGAAGLVWILLSRFERKLDATMEKLERLANLDDLTGIPNRRRCLERLEQEVQRAQRFQRPVSVSIMDLDGFKSINDTRGHLVGDRTLVNFTRVVTAHIRTQDFFGRLGGDEFLVIFIETEPKDAATILERIREQWSRSYAPSPVSGARAVTLSAGITSPQAGDFSITECLRRADEALYQAKAGGRNKIEIS